MKTIKTAKQIFDEELSGEPLTEDSVIEVIKFAQKDAIRKTVKECAENAYCDMIHPPDEDYPELEESEYMVVKSSILSVADKLIKEL